jgi:hypothetical protein
MTHTGDDFRTNDLTLAVVLALAGFEYRIEKLTKRTAVWDFPTPGDEPAQEKFEDILSDFTEWEHSVEPRAFVAKWSEMRRELFNTVEPLRSFRPSPAAQG